jgi:hypothetical protein
MEVELTRDIPGFVRGEILERTETETRIIFTAQDGRVFQFDKNHYSRPPRTRTLPEDDEVHPDSLFKERIRT